MNTMNIGDLLATMNTTDHMNGPEELKEWSGVVSYHGLDDDDNNDSTIDTASSASMGADSDTDTHSESESMKTGDGLKLIEVNDDINDNGDDKSDKSSVYDADIFDQISNCDIGVINDYDAYDHDSKAGRIPEFIFLHTDEEQKQDHDEDVIEIEFEKEEIDYQFEKNGNKKTDDETVMGTIATKMLDVSSSSFDDEELSFACDDDSHYDGFEDGEDDEEEDISMADDAYIIRVHDFLSMTSSTVDDEDSHEDNEDCIDLIDNLMEQFEADQLELKNDMFLQFGGTNNANTNYTTEKEESESFTVPLPTISSAVPTIPSTTPKPTPTEYNTIGETPKRTKVITEENAITSVNINRTRENKTTKKAMINTNIICSTPDTIVSSSSLCFSTTSSSCHVDGDDSSSGGGGIVSPVRPNVLQFDNTNDIDEENEIFEEATCFSTTTSSCHVDADDDGDGSGGSSGSEDVIVSPVSPRVFLLNLDDDNDNDEENEVFKEAMCFSTISSGCYVEDDVSDMCGGGIVCPVCSRVLQLEDENDHNEEEHEILETAILSPIQFILLVILIPFLYHRSASFYGFQNNTNSLSNSNCNSNSNRENGRFVTNSIPSSNTASGRASFGSSIGTILNDNVGTTTPIQSIRTPLMSNTATATTFFYDEEMDKEKKDTKIKDPAVTTKKVDMDMDIVEDNNKIPTIQTPNRNNNNNNYNNTNSIAAAATTELFIADADAATVSTTFNTLTTTATHTTTSKNRNTKTSTEQIQTQKQMDDHVIAFTTTTVVAAAAAAAAAAADIPPIVTPPKVKSKPNTVSSSSSSSSLLLENNNGMDDTVVTAINTNTNTNTNINTTATTTTTTTTTTDNSIKAKQKQKKNDVVVDDDIVEIVVESIPSTATIAVASVPRSVPLAISKLVSTSENIGGKIKNNNNNNNTTATDNNNKSNNMDTTSNTTATTNPTPFSRVKVEKVQFFPVLARVNQYFKRHLREICKKRKQLFQQLCHSVEQHREYRIRARNLFQQQTVKRQQW